MSHPSLWSRIRTGRLVQVLIVYLGVSWLVVQVVSDLRDMLGLPAWIGPVTMILLAIGLIIILATAWVQSHPLVDAREAADEVPSSWELDLGDAVATLRRGRLPHLTWSRALVGGVVAFSLLIGAAGLYVLLRSDANVFGTREASAESAPDGIAVLPFTVRGGDIDDWREGMVDLLSTGLDGAGGLRAIASRTVLARWHESVPGADAPDQDMALDVARRVGARYALMGQAVAIGPSVRLTVDVYELDGRNARSLGQRQVEGHPDSVLALVDRLSLLTLALVLRESGGDLPQVDLASVTTSSLPALKSYLEGETLYRRGDFEAAAEAYERAVATDTLFALAYWRLSQAMGWNENIRSPRGIEANAVAVRLIDRLPAREAMLARATLQTRRFEQQNLATLQEAVRRYPDDAEAWYQLGDTYYHQTGALVDWDEIEEAFQRAVTLAPRMAPYRLHLLDGAFRYHADSALVRRQLSELERLAPGSAQLTRYRLAEQLAFGEPADRDSVLSGLVGASNPMLGGQVAMLLRHPRFTKTRSEMGAVGYARLPAVVRAGIVRDRGFSLIFALGQVRAGVEAFRDPALPPHEWPEAVLAAPLNGLPMAPELLARAESELDPRGPAAFVAAAYAATRQRWDAHAAGIARLRERSDSLLGAGDSIAARRTRGDARVLEAFGVWKRGRADDAARMMTAALTDVPNVDEWSRWWLGTLHLERGQWRQAEPYFRSFMKFEPDPLAAYHLAQVYEATDRAAQARPLYAFFIEQWANADPEVMPLVEDARQRLGRLSAEGR